MSIVTKGYGNNTLICKGYGNSIFRKLKLLGLVMLSRAKIILSKIKNLRIES